MNHIIKAQTIKGSLKDIHISDSEIYVDNEARKRSGHMSHALAEFGKGKIIDFNSNCAYERAFGHSAFGWIEYRISEDGGQTFGEVQELPYAKQAFLDGVYTISVEKAVSKGNNCITVFCLRNTTHRACCCEPWDTPTYVRSEDGGKTWSEAVELCKYRGRIYDAVYHEDSIYVLMFCNDAEESFIGSKPEHLYRIYKSDDDGKTFYEHCVVPFEETEGRAYCTMQFTLQGDLIVYAYNSKNEEYMDYIISNDKGKTWTKSGTSYVAQKIRNPQINILDGQYILHGRRGAVSGFVVYTSKDGINWDEGTVLEEVLYSCYYSNNIVLDHPTKKGKKRMLVQFSQNYNMDDSITFWDVNVFKRVNVMHMWIESV